MMATTMAVPHQLIRTGTGLCEVTDIQEYLCHQSDSAAGGADDMKTKVTDRVMR
jgi:hypothetical protein